MQAALDQLFAATFGAPPVSQDALAGDGSRRRMVRMRGEDGSTVVGVIGPDALENRAFLSYSRTFAELGLPVPRVHAADEEVGVYLLDDLGDVTLFDALSAARGRDGRLPPEILTIYKRVLELLPRFQVEGGRAVDYGVAYPRARYDAQAMHWDLNYFKYNFLKLAHVPFHETRLEEDFQRLTRWLSGAGGRHFVYRDLQTRNIMVIRGEPWFIDYQGGLQGPLQYDVAKLLYEGKAGLDESTRDELLDHYFVALESHERVPRDRFLAHFRGFVVLRILQGLGAYGYLGLYGRKPQFLARIPHAIEDLEVLLATGLLPLDVPELRGVFERMIADDALRMTAAPAAPGLTVRVGSFSYKRGLPTDPSGHGGGFAFDCRALPNPGRLAEFAGRSGLDESVAAWLEQEPETERFFEHALGLVVAQVERYLERGFDSLQVLFGCTGGQHRSPYMASRLAAALAERFPDIETPVAHHETLHWPTTARRPDASPLPGSGR